MKHFFTILLVLVMSVVIFPQTEDIKITGGVQIRSELDGRDFSNTTHAIHFTSLRTRLGVSKKIGDFSFFAQVQDSRVFGEEGNTSTDLKNVDLHQGYVILDKIFNLPLSIQAGRFEMVYGTERFFGASNWSLTGRAFDGARLSFSFSDNLKTDLFGITHTELNRSISNATPGTYPNPIPDERTFSIYGMWNQIQIDKMNKLDVFAYYELNRAKSNGVDDNLSRITLGLNHNGTFSQFYDVVEAAYQTGTIFNTDIAAYLISLQFGYSMTPFKFGVGFDLYSGNDITKDTYGSFTTGYGTGHKFLGYMDYFVNIPVNTQDNGLNDIYATFTFAPVESKFSFNFMIHHFMTNSDVDPNAFGQELDLTIRYEFVKNVNLQWGGSVFIPGDRMKNMYRTPNGVREDTAFWSYLMVSAAF